MTAQVNHARQEVQRSIGQRRGEPVRDLLVIQATNDRIQDLQAKADAAPVCGQFAGDGPNDAICHQNVEARLSSTRPERFRRRLSDIGGPRETTMANRAPMIRGTIRVDKLDRFAIGRRDRSQGLARIHTGGSCHAYEQATSLVYCRCARGAYGSNRYDYRACRSGVRANQPDLEHIRKTHHPH